ncbi:hypothetical protein HYN59_11500 [Flavobacterium album]|uniref:Uncharacterized protein n=1 Tax=Flavobacterium album TaxID=2175091 RepID=A0A2S1QZ44_9FLAO|nr:hypothetical protein [Flavobacterium album]AWH85693.1 hypothetical protein HYN59_11500 [Flavobacterium album]
MANLVKEFRKEPDFVIISAMRTTLETMPCANREKGCIDHNDSAGTNPNRNNYEQVNYTSYRQNFMLVPDNHPTPEERLLHPDKGELDN